MNQPKKTIPKGLEAITEKFPDFTESDVENLQRIPRLSKLNPRFLYLAYLMQSNAYTGRELSSDFLNENKMYSGKTLRQWMDHIFDKDDLKNDYKFKVELMSYVVKIGKSFGNMKEDIVYYDREEEEEEQEEEEVDIDLEEYASDYD